MKRAMEELRDIRETEDLSSCSGREVAGDWFRHHSKKVLDYVTRSRELLGWAARSDPEVEAFLKELAEQEREEE